MGPPLIPSGLALPFWLNFQVDHWGVPQRVADMHVLCESRRELRVTGAEEVLHAVAQGNARRVSAGRTPAGRRCPSRAHAIFTLNLMQRRKGDPAGEDAPLVTSKLHFVDLAGEG